MSESETKSSSEVLLLSLPKMDKITNDFINGLMEQGYNMYQIQEITKECNNRVRLILSLTSLSLRLKT